LSLNIIIFLLATHQVISLVQKSVQVHRSEHWKSETNNKGDSSNFRVCLCRSLKRLTDDHNDLVSKQVIYSWEI